MTQTETYQFHAERLPNEKLPKEYLDYWNNRDIDDVNHVVGVAFRPKQGRLYEFQNPDTHDEYEKLVDPRDGDTVTFDGRGEQMLQGGLFMELKKILVPAEWWNERRQKYVNGTEWSEAWNEATPSMDEHLEELSRAASKQNMERSGGW